ncbi:lipoprotein insertase outer membrane protein LolB [Marinicella gelatinilytica]|uniref:lipoprotein insertase outer membrane protein LolB n=1 Tax=Marinicella gelatinilytica TaxID=2996017 RepID=UPI002260C08B|nr:lipoprotein insertase outer membrane protein LolB [Marinicella gelatinilytica]MCX7544459.1 lipoprotein insertase outer membrane protein LolB [Marinicella gelatinilytica]
MDNFGALLQSRFMLRDINVGLIVVCCVVLLSGCQNFAKKPSNCDMAGDFDFQNFQLTGKLALSDGQEGGSGQFKWHHLKSATTAQFKAPMGQGDWYIEETLDGATMIVNNEDSYHASSATTLIEDAVGWPVPWEALKKWLVARPLNQEQAVIHTTENSKTISEQGWDIVYDRFQEYPKACLPHRIMASKPPYSIRLVIRDWQWP